MRRPSSVPVGSTRSAFTPPPPLLLAIVIGSWRQPGGSAPISPKASIPARRSARVGAGAPGGGWREAISARTPAISGSFQLDIRPAPLFF